MGASQTVLPFKLGRHDGPMRVKVLLRKDRSVEAERAPIATRMLPLKANLPARPCRRARLVPFMFCL